jgi:hypothetical protein
LANDVMRASACASFSSANCGRKTDTGKTRDKAPRGVLELWCQPVSRSDVLPAEASISTHTNAPSDCPCGSRSAPRRRSCAAVSPRGTPAGRGRADNSGNGWDKRCKEQASADRQRQRRAGVPPTPSSLRKAVSVIALHPAAGAALQSNTWCTVGPHWPHCQHQCS